MGAIPANRLGLEAKRKATPKSKELGSILNGSLLGVGNTERSNFLTHTQTSKNHLVIRLLLD